MIKVKRITVSVPKDVINDLNSLGPINKSKIVADAMRAEIERVRGDGIKPVSLRVLNFCEYPVILTSDDNRPVRIEPSKLPAVPKQEVGVVIVAPWPLAARMDVEGRTDVWAVPRS